MTKSWIWDSTKELSKSTRRRLNMKLKRCKEIRLMRIHLAEAPRPGSTGAHWAGEDAWMWAAIVVQGAWEQELQKVDKEVGKGPQSASPQGRPSPPNWAEQGPPKVG